MSALGLFLDIKKAREAGQKGGMIIHHNFPNELMEDLRTLLLAQRELEEIKNSPDYQAVQLRKVANRKLLIRRKRWEKKHVRG